MKITVPQITTPELTITIRKPATPPRLRRLALLALPLVAVAVAALLLGGGHEGATPVEAGTLSSADFSLAVDVNGDGIPDCTTKPGEAKNECGVPVGSTFTVQVSLNSFNLPDKDLDGKFGYNFFQARVNFGAGLVLKNRAGTAELVHPDCAGGVTAETKGANTYDGSCFIVGLGANESTFLGVVMEVDFNCNATGSVTLVHGIGDTYIADENGLLLANDPQGASEVLIIRCKKDTPDFNLVVEAGGVVSEGCNQAINDKKCLVSPGSKFTVQVFLDSLGNMATNGYDLMSVGLSYSPGLTRQNRPGGAEMVWPDCVDATERDLGVSGDNRAYQIECFSPDSFFTSSLTPVVEVDFVCPQGLDTFGNLVKSVEYVTITHGKDFGENNVFDTQLRKFGISVTKFDTPAAETVVIQCDNYFPWDVHGPNQSVELDGKVDLFNDIVGVISHFGQTKP